MSIDKKTKLATFEELAIPHLSFIYRSAYRLCGNPTDAEDLSQDTFQMAFEKFTQLRDPNKVKSWLFVILRNTYMKRLGKEKKYVHLDIDMDKINYNPHDAKNIENNLGFNRTLSGELQAALDKLAEKYKTPVLLSYIGGYSYQEIADMLHIPIGTVMSRIARGKMFLKKEIIQAGEKEN
jgi:RNA polymerase sigma-70 factor (ECF subfamily)